MIFRVLLMCASFIISPIVGQETTLPSIVKDLKASTIRSHATKPNSKQKIEILPIYSANETVDSITASETSEEAFEMTNSLANGGSTKSVNQSMLSTKDSNETLFSHGTSRTGMPATAMDINTTMTVHVTNRAEDENDEDEENDENDDDDDDDRKDNKCKGKRKKKCENGDTRKHTTIKQQYSKSNFEIEYEGCYNVRRLEKDFTIPTGTDSTLRICFSLCNEKEIGLHKANDTLINCYCLEDDKMKGKRDDDKCTHRCSLEGNYSCGGLTRKGKRPNKRMIPLLSRFKGEFKEAAPTTVLPYEYEQKIGVAVGVTIGIVLFVIVAAVLIVCGLKRYKPRRSVKNAAYEESSVYDQVDYNEIATSCSLEGSSNVQLLNGAYRNLKRNPVNERGFVNVASESITEMDEGTYHKLTRQTKQSAISVDNMEYLLPRDIIRPPTYLEVMESSPTMKRRDPNDAVPAIPVESALDRISGAYYIVEKRPDVVSSKDRDTNFALKEQIGNDNNDNSLVGNATNATGETSNINEDTEKKFQQQESVKHLSSEIKDSITPQPQPCTDLKDGTMHKEVQEALQECPKGVSDATYVNEIKEDRSSSIIENDINYDIKQEHKNEENEVQKENSTEELKLVNGDTNSANSEADMK